jgi:DNA repair photolyase
MTNIDNTRKMQLNPYYIGDISNSLTKLTGTKQWASSNFNFIDGCSNNCKYCYARAMAARHKRIHPDKWSDESVRLQAFRDRTPNRMGAIMCPSSHDIVPQNLEKSLIMLSRLIDAGNNLIVVTKPHLKCVKAMCAEFKNHKQQILFRFTIGSADSGTLKFWEPNAPSFEERLESLKFAFSKGYQTSVSCEPMLDNNIGAVVEAVAPYTTESIWIGKANRLKSQLALNGYRDETTAQKAEELLAWQSDDNIIDLYHTYKHNPLIRWKDSIETVLKRHNLLVEHKQFYSDLGISVEDAIRIFTKKYYRLFYSKGFYMELNRDYLREYCSKCGIELDWTFFNPDSIREWVNYLVERPIDADYLKGMLRTLPKFLNWCVTNQSFNRAAIKSAA